MLLGMLPPIVHIRGESEQAYLLWSVELMMKELREGQPSNALVAEHLAHPMLVQALRVHLDGGAGGGVGWFFALADAAQRSDQCHPRRSRPSVDLAGAGPARRHVALDLRAPVQGSVGEPPMQ
jgi:hypothetical protein